MPNSWESERSLVLYKLEELRLGREADREILHKIEEMIHANRKQLDKYQASLSTMKWVAGILGGAVAFIAQFAYKVFH